MGLEIFGKKVFDLSAPFGHFEAWSTIIFVVFISFVIFLVLSKKAKRYQDSKKAHK